MPDPIPVAEMARLQDDALVHNYKECILCGRPDREDYIMRRLHERGFSCRHCKSPGFGVHGFVEPLSSAHRIPRLIQNGYFNRYEAFE